MPKYLNLDPFVGKLYGRLTVLSIERRNTILFCKAECSCGKIKEYRHAKLANGHTKSCGCFRKEYLSQKMTIHANNKTRLHRIWVGMIDRCRRHKNSTFTHYGGRGITVCQDWMVSFSAFKDWAASTGYTESLSIDRIDVNGNYEPSNCRWATQAEQCRNTRSSHLIEYNGEIKTVAEWAETLSMNYNTLLGRINNYHWPISKALTTPVSR